MPLPSLVTLAHPGWAAAVQDLLPGTHVAILALWPESAIEGRMAGLELRDTLLCLSHGPQASFCFLFRKPCQEPTVADQMAATRTGALNIMASRIAYQGDGDKTPVVGKGVPGQLNPNCGPTLPSRKENWGEWHVNHSGRWPSNVALIHAPGCVSVGTKRVKATSIHGEFTAIRRTGVHSEAGGHQTIGREQPVTGYADAEGLETVAAWSCEPGCPVPLLDQQSGELKSGFLNQTSVTADNRIYGQHDGYKNPKTYAADSGGASRFYPQFADEAALRQWIERLITPV